MPRWPLLMVLVIALVLAPACSNRKATPIPGASDTHAAPEPGMPQPSAMPAGHPSVEPPAAGMETGGKPEVLRDIVEPPSVKGQWKAVKLEVKEKATGKVTVLEAALDSKTVIPGSDLSVTASHYLPSFVMQDKTISSVNNEPNNPAVKVVVKEGDKVLHEGWLFQRFPEVHAFEHPKFEIHLLGGIPGSTGPAGN